MAAEIQIEQFNVTPTNNGETHTLHNDVGNVNSAFVRLTTSSDKSSGGPIGDTGDCNANVAHCAAVLTDTDEITFYKGTSTQVRVMGEVWRYTGSSGGANEFIVRGRFAISASGTSTSQAVSGIVNEDKCVPFITGNSNSFASNSEYGKTTFAARMDGSGNVLITSGNSSAAATVYVTVVEFTGANWSVGHGVSTNHDSADEIVILNEDSDGVSGSTFDVGNWETAFIEATMEGDSGTETGLSDLFVLAYPDTSTSASVFDIHSGDGGARNDSDGWIHVIKHPGIVVKRGNGAITEGNGDYGGTINGPSEVPATTLLNEMALEWYVDTSGTGTAHKRGSLVAYIATGSGEPGLNYDQGDPFNSDDYDSTKLGIWTFTGLIFPASPEGVLVEAGGTGTGMGVFYNDDGDFVARGGAGGSVAPSDCARLVIPTASYNFANKSGSMIVTIDVDNNKIDLEFDENSNGSVDYTGSYIASSSFANWSGGNDGYCGNSNGNIAGSETTTYLFNGTIGNMNFIQEDTEAVNVFIEHWVHRSGNNVIGRWGIIDFTSVTASEAGTNFQINIGEFWKSINTMKINIGDSWKNISGAQINVAGSWKEIF